MAEQTSNYNLNKPVKNDYVSIRVLNQNMDIIDSVLKQIEKEIQDNSNFDFGDITLNK